MPDTETKTVRAKVLRDFTDAGTERRFTKDKRYFLGRVFGMPENADGADSMLMANPTVEICTKIVKVAAA